MSMTGTLTTDLVLIKLAQNDALKEDLQILSHLSRDKFCWGKQCTVPDGKLSEIFSLSECLFLDLIYVCRSTDCYKTQFYR